MSWEDAESKAKEYGTGLFAKLKSDGDTLVCSFLGEPLARETVYIDGKTIDLDKDDPTHAAVRAALKLRFNVFVPGQGIKILELSQTTFGKVIALKKKYGLEGKLFEITRIGTGKKTDYQILPERDCTPEELEAIKGSEMHDLTPRPQSDDSDGGSEGNAAGNGSSHANEYVDELKGRLKQLPRDVLTQFLATFSVAKIKDLTEADYAKADAFVTSAESERDGGGVDPFAD